MSESQNGSIIKIETLDGYSLSGRVYSAPNPTKAIFLFGAMGVPQKFYESFAQFFAKNDCAVLTFDPRGMGESRQEPLSKMKTNIFTWAKLDVEAALQELISRLPNTPITWIGHSLGGQIIPLTPSHNKVSKFITIASGTGWWRENSPELRKRVWMLWYGFAPILTPIFGYFPGRRLGMVGDLPGGVMMQWRKWCLNPEYLIGVEGDDVRSLYSNFKLPITSLSFTDDEMMSEKNINSLYEFYSSAIKKMLRFSPEQLMKKRIGHFGFFKKGNEDLWWDLVMPEIKGCS